MEQQQQQLNQPIQFTKENYILAVQNLFGKNQQGVHKDTIKQANKYLVDFERSKDAWGICGQILLENTQDEILLFQCTKFLKSKLEYDFGQLNQNEVQEFAKTLLQIITLHSSKDMKRGQRAQFSLILIYIYFHTFQTWPDFIQFLQQNYYENAACHPFLYSVYEEIPRELDNQHFVIDEEIRDHLFKHLKDNLQIRVVKELANLQQNNQDVQTQYYGLKCLTNWLQLAYNKEVWDLLENHPLLNLALESTDSCELQEKSTDVLLVVLGYIQRPQDHPQLFLKIAQAVFSYFEKCAQAIKEDLPDEIDVYMQIFRCFGKKAAEEFITNPTQVSEQFFQNFLELTEVQNIDNSKDIASFWKKFFVTLCEQKEPQLTQYKQRYEHLIRKLINICVKRIVISPAQFVEYNKNKATKVDDLQEEFEIKCHDRVEFKEMLEAVTWTITTDLTIQVICDDILKADIDAWQAIVSNPQSATEQNKIQIQCNLESSLSCICYLLRIQPIEKQQGQKTMIIQLMELILDNITQNTDQIKLIRTCMKYFTFFPHFLEGNTALQGKAFQFLSNNFKTKYISSLASEAFDKVCQKNCDFVKNNLDDFFKLLDNFSQNEEIVTGLATAICSEESYIQKYFVRLCMPYATKIKQIVENSQEVQQNLEPGETLQVCLTDQFDLLTLIIRQVPQVDNGSHQIVSQIFQEVWPLLQKLFLNERKEDVLEKMVRFIKYTMRCIRMKFAPFLKSLFESVISAMEKYPTSPLLYMIEVTSTVFGENQEYVIFLSEVLKRVYEICINTFKQYDTILEAFYEDPNLVEDFFGMWSRIQRYAPEVMLNLNIYDSILQLLANGSQLQHPKAAKMMFTFAEQLCILFYPFNIPELEKKDQQTQQLYLRLKQTLSENGQNMIVKSFEALVQYPPAIVSENIADMVYAFTKAFNSETSSVWFPQACQQVFSVDILTESEKQKIMEAIRNVETQKGQDDYLKLLEVIVERCNRSYMRKHNQN